MNTDASTTTLTTKPASSSPSPSPSPRVGAAATTLGGKIYLFSGRGGVAMTPIEEHGGLWAYDPSTSAWSFIEPTPVPSGTDSSSSSSSSYPPARSYHCMASDDDTDTIYLHAGCPEKGRLSDLWAFRLSSRTWTRLAPAPDPPRGGASIAFSRHDGRLYRVNGFDGKSEQGGTVDVYSPETDSWTSVPYEPDGKDGPAPRSVSALLPVTVAGRPSLVTLFGERDPSALGHQGAGKMLGDVWAFDIEERRWRAVDAKGDGEGTAARPVPRGWFAADVLGEDKIVVQGGLGESNERLGDVWVLSF